MLAADAQGVDEAGKARFPTFEKVDARTFRFKLLQRDVLFHYAVGSIYAVPKHKWEAAYKAGDFGQAMRINTPPGDIPTSGPFVVKEVRSDERVVLERNPRFWKVDREGNRLPYLDRMIILVVPDFNAAFLKFREGETDLLEVRPEHFDPLRRKEATGDYVVSDLGPSFNTNWLILNQDRRLSSEGKPYVEPMKQKWFQNKNFRKAISHAIDRETFIREVLDGRGKAIGSHFSPTDAGYVHLAGMYPYDPARARALLQEAGVRLPLKMTLTLPPTPYARAGGPVVAADLAKVGIVHTLEQVEWPQWLAGAFKGQFDMTLINHVEPLDYQIYTDPAYYFGYDSAPFRSLVERHAASINARERQMLFVEIQRHLAKDAANAWIFAPQISTVLRKGIKGVWMNYPIFAHDIAAMRWE